MHEIFVWLPCMKTLALEFFAFVVNWISLKKQLNKHNFEISQVDAVPVPRAFFSIPVHIPGL